MTYIPASPPLSATKPPSPVFSPLPPTSPTSSSLSTTSPTHHASGNSNNGTRIWVHTSALEGNSSSSSTASCVSTTCSSSSFSFASRAAAAACSSSSSKVVSGSLAALRARNSSSPNNTVNASLSHYSVISDSESDTVGSATSQQVVTRCLQWNWTEAYLLEHAKNHVVIRVNDECHSVSSDAWNQNTLVLANTEEDGTPKCPEDLITLTHLHEPSVVECLQHRYARDLIYTRTGPVLLALNPFQTLRGLYGEGSMKKYWDGSNTTEQEPHVYAIADASFRHMMLQLELGKEANQSILVSGESGSGKTVTTKFVMKYLAALSHRAQAVEKRAYLQVAERRQQQQQQQPSTPRWSQKTLRRSMSGGSGRHSPTVSSTPAATHSIESQVLQSNPILESFGNARTVRNDNSSRFGKFMEIRFTRGGQLVGASLETYLLEKVRLVHQSIGERNYHIFYELLSSDVRELRQFFLASTAAPEDFAILNGGNTYDRRDGVTDKETFRSLKTAMDTMKFTSKEQKDIFSVVAGILHASNLTFCEVRNDASSLEERNVHMEPVRHLWGVTSSALNQALCSVCIRAGKDTTVTRSLTPNKARKGLEALLKATYGALFAYLVKRINASIAHSKDQQDEEKDKDVTKNPTIGVLDIFGFESFTKNSFEQLCINYCNEALQQQFNSFVLKNEQAEYEKEGIEWSFIEFPENQDVLDLIECKNTGMLSILDDACLAPGTTDKTFALDVYKRCEKSNRFSASRKQRAVMQFSLHHYAGAVEYTVDGFVEKNRDELPKETTELLQNSTNLFIRELADIIHGSSESKQVAESSTPCRRRDSSVARTTVGGQFRKQLKILRTKIDSTSPHYIRCLKPNDHLIPDHFDRAVVAEQLRCGGILEAVRVARAGFTQHYPHEDFYQRYRALARKELRTTSTSGGICTSAIKASPWKGRNSFGGTNPASWGGVSPRPIKKWEPPRNGAFHCSSPRSSDPPPPRNGVYRCSSSPRSIVSPRTTAGASNAPHEEVDYEAKCKQLVKVLCRKIHQVEEEQQVQNSGSATGNNNCETPEPPAARARSYCYQSPPPAWSRNVVRVTKNDMPTPPLSTAPSVKSRYAPWEKKQQSSETPKPKQLDSSSYRSPSASFRMGATDLAKIGIQLGKTKVFLRHKAFEQLERMRSQLQTAAATRVNAIFRMYLARRAYVEVLDAVRSELREHLFVNDDSSKETKEQEYGEITLKIRAFSCSTPSSLVGNWESQVRMSIHNPTPRSEWGKQTPVRSFKWMLVDGIWVKNRTSDDAQDMQ